MFSARDPAEHKESQQKTTVVSPVTLFSSYLAISAARTGQSFLLIPTAPPGEGAGEATAESREGQEDSREGRCGLFIGLGWLCRETVTRVLLYRWLSGLAVRVPIPDVEEGTLMMTTVWSLFLNLRMH